MKKRQQKGRFWYLYPLNDYSEIQIEKLQNTMYNIKKKDFMLIRLKIEKSENLQKTRL